MTEPMLTSPHLSELLLNRFLYEALVMPAAERSVVESHLASCDICRRLADDVRAFDQAVVLVPPSSAPTPSIPTESLAPVTALGSRPQPSVVRPKRWLGVALGLAAAAALVLFLLPPKPSSQLKPDIDDGIRIKGAGFDVTFHVHDGEGSRQVDRGDVVHPGERVGFRVLAPDDGYILIVGIDETLEPYVCYPQGGGGRAGSLAGRRVPTDLNEAMAFDGVLGKERLVALWCPTSVTLDSFRDAFVRAAQETAGDRALEPLVPGCRQRDIVLEKR